MLDKRCKRVRHGDLPNRQLKIAASSRLKMPLRDLPNRQLKILSRIGARIRICDLPNRQLKSAKIVILKSTLRCLPKR